MDKENRHPRILEDASKAIAQYEKRNHYEALRASVPLEVCKREDLDFSVWSLVATDACLQRIADYLLGRTSRNNKTLQRFHHEEVVLTRLNLCDAQQITDSGLGSLSQACTSLKWLSLENSRAITSIGLSLIINATSSLSSHSSLEYLSVSDCVVISGSGFGIIGSKCAKLKVLLLARCSQIKPSALVKIFAGCKHLEVLDFTSCKMISDDELKILSENCSNLRELNLSECPKISDTGIYHISNGSCCSSLHCLDIARSSLPCRITDVSLMSLGEKCAALTKINLTGCEMIADAGIAWLAKGCRNLSYINLTKCFKVTNAGMRHLGENCTGLKTVILVNVKRVSDVGIRLLANGCPTLERLNVSGLFMLSDGMKRDFGLEGLQALGKALCANSLKVLSLQDCTQISTTALVAISSLTNLETLVLSGCTNLSLDGIRAISISCSRIETLSLSNCGNCCCDKMVELVTRNMQRLRVISLAGCEKIGKNAIKAIASCRFLSHVDFTGCRISDQDLIPLCEFSFEPGLETLILSHCGNVGNMALSWISDGISGSQKRLGAIRLTTLALKYTKVTYQAAKAVRDGFPDSELVMTDEIFGFYPHSRIGDRRIIQLFTQKEDALQKLHCSYRCHLAQQRLLLLREQSMKKRTVVIVQHLWFVYVAKVELNRLKLNLVRKTRSATCLQQFYRLIEAKLCADLLRQELRLKISVVKSKRIQCIFRGIEGRRRASSARRQHKELTLTRHNCSILIQCRRRSCLSKREMIQRFRFQKRLQEKRCQSVLTLQSWHRILIAKTITKQLEERLQEMYEQQQFASKVIVRAFKANSFQQALYRKVAHTKTCLRMATTIQNMWRKFLAFRELGVLLKLHVARKVFESCIAIQCQVRCTLSRLKAKRIIDAAKALTAKNEANAAIIHRFWTSMQFKQRMYHLRYLYYDRLRRILELQIYSSTLIASTWRGKIGRDEARSAKNRCNHRWKQLWSEEEKRVFYYNQITGEIRWTKPQALLDLEKRPLCSNCEYYDAVVECATCAEYFCDQCYGAIHFCGKRSQHQVRALYDFYGRRFDYGDQRLATWPSDVDQEEYCKVEGMES